MLTNLMSKFSHQNILILFFAISISSLGFLSITLRKLKLSFSKQTYDQFRMQLRTKNQRPNRCRCAPPYVKFDSLMRNNVPLRIYISQPAFDGIKACIKQAQI